MTEASAKITACMMAIDNLPESGDYDARVAIWTNTKLFLEHLSETLEDDDIKQDFWAHRPIHGSKRKRAYSVHDSSEKTLVVVQDELPNLNVDDDPPIASLASGSKAGSS